MKAKIENFSRNRMNEVLELIEFMEKGKGPLKLVLGEDKPKGDLKERYILDAKELERIGLNQFVLYLRKICVNTTQKEE